MIVDQKSLKALPPTAGDDIFYQVFKAQDKYFILAVGTERLWAAFCDALGLDHLKADQRFATNPDRIRHRAGPRARWQDALEDLP